MESNLTLVFGLLGTIISVAGIAIASFSGPRNFIRRAVRRLQHFFQRAPPRAIEFPRLISNGISVTPRFDHGGRPGLIVAEEIRLTRWRSIYYPNMLRTEIPDQDSDWSRIAGII
ncbi:hypothetical protein ACMFMG_011117 [Clarireedia jacksonii]